MKLKDVKQLCGRDFEIVKEGLDESQVAAVVSELVDERDALLQRQEHLVSLTRLAERTVADADKLAEDIKREADAEARNRTAKILARAEQEAQEIMEQKRAQILATTNKEAEAIKAGARQEAELLMREQKQQVEQQLKEMVQKLHGQLVSGLKGMVEQAIALQAEWKNELPELVADSLPPDKDEMPSASVPVTPEQKVEKASPITLDTDRQHKGDVLGQLEQAWEDAVTPVPSAEHSPATPRETAHQPEKKTVDKAAVAIDGKGVPASYEGTVELNILPPLSPNQLVEIQRYLREWPGIGITELKPSSNGYSITVILYKPMQLVDILKQLPEVADARECVADDAKALVNGAPGKDRLRKITITTSKHA